ncbi:DNA polymerase III subunit gamma/tau [Candidatus Daviesbacteria bacterium]|nr:DNA polymerase III subunit gamma/tau [Candidatus Daviesbacteria bacterium]
MTYYLKYRPKSLDDLTGQDVVKKNLMSAFQNNRLSHAYLFVGPRGTGKTSTARILAKMVNCEFVNRESLIMNRKDKNDNRYTINNIPCNRCDTCLSITDGSNLDLIEIDAASNRGIEDIRSLREKIKLAPTAANKKVYIIDEVHMLTPEAFNALLKTLEEPPQHALFILATTEGSKIPQTILSRVQRLDFKLASQEELSQVLKKIIKIEKIDISEEALQILKTAAQGSFRDAIKILDQVSGISDKVQASEIRRILHGTDIEQVLSLLENLAKHDVKSSILLISNLEKFGIDFKLFTGAVMEIMRALVLIKNDLGPSLVQPQYGSGQYSTLLTLTNQFTAQDLSSSLNIFQKSYEKLKTTSIPSLPLELAVIEICGEETNKTVDDRRSKLEVEDRKLKIIEVKDGSLKSPIIQYPQSNDDIQKLKEKWTYVCETIRPYNFSLEALLRSINITECTDTAVIVEVPYSFHQRILEAPKNRELLESILSDILGRIIKVSTVLGNRPAKAEDVANIEVAADDEIIRAAAEIFNSDTVN